MSDQDTTQWHLDRRVPIALLIGLLVQFGGFGWWAAQMSAQTETNAREVARVDARVSAEVARIDTVVSAAGRAAQAQAVQLGRIEENVAALRVDIGRLLQRLDGGR